MATRFCCFGISKSTKKRNIHNIHYRGRGQSGNDFHLALKNVRLFSYNELMSATGGFHLRNRVGKGGFGIVYKGVLNDGTRVAVKSLSAESKQGTIEFLNEIDTISNVRHPNLVCLLGCCVEGSNRMLVYEYLENNSLANALLGPKSKQIFMDWTKRADICLGTARALAFLHEEADPHIVHRDIKASNILLDKDLNPKIGDFGLAKLFPDTVTHISTRVAGTMGYLAPEYALLGQLTKKADIYSFGVLMLETISGRSNSRNLWGNGMKLLVEWTWNLRDEDRLLDIVDPELVSYPEEEVLHFIKVSLFCTQALSQYRPSMTEVVEMLSEDMPLDVKSLSQPGVVKDTHRTSTELGVYGSGSTGFQNSNPTASNTYSGSDPTTTELQPR